MRKTIFCFLFCGILCYAGVGQSDTSPLRVTTFARYAGGVDKDKVMDLFQGQQFEEAIGYLSQVLQADSNNLPVLNYAGYAYYMSDNMAAATECYEHMLQIDSNSITALHYLLLLQQNDDPSAALNHALRLVDLQPLKASWWRMAGELWRRKAQPDSALDCLVKAYTLSSRDVKNVAALGELLVDGKAYGRADSIVDIALGSDSLNTTLLRLRAKSAYAAKDYASVLGPGERLLQMKDMFSLSALEWLSLSYYDLKKYDECVRVCETLQEMGFDIEAVYYYEGRAEAKLRHYEHSNELMRIALSKAISKTAEWYYDDLGDNYESLKDYKKAVAHYDTTYYLFKDPIALYTCGRICESELHNIPLARQYYRRYLAVAKPESPEEKEAYKYVKQRWGKPRG